MNRSVLSVVVAFLVLLVALMCGGPWMRAMTVTDARLDEAVAQVEAARVRDTLDRMDPDTRARVTDRCKLEVLRCTPATCGIDIDEMTQRKPTVSERRLLTELVDRCVRRQEAAEARGVHVVDAVEPEAAPGDGEVPLWLVAIGALGSCGTSVVLLGMVAATLLGRGAAR